MTDRIYESFLAWQLDEAMALAAASDILELTPMNVRIPQRYVATFRCKGLVQAPDGEIVEADRFVTGYDFPPDYLRVVHPGRTVVLFEPKTIWHPNILAPSMCLGHIAPGTPLVDLIYRSFELITYSKRNTNNALNYDAAAWTRQHQSMFPLDRRPLKRRTIAIGIGQDNGHVHP